MAERVLGDSAVVETLPDGVKTWLPGTPESEMPGEFVETLGDHVWATDDDVEEGLAGFVARSAQERAAAVATSTIDDPDADPDDTAGENALDSLTKAELHALAEANGLHTSGTKDELVERLTEAGIG